MKEAMIRLFVALLTFCLVESAAGLVLSLFIAMGDPSLGFSVFAVSGVTFLVCVGVVIACGISSDFMKDRQK